jgi:AcrR family transcriptional regulator
MAGNDIALEMPRHKSISDEDLLDRALPVMARLGPSGYTLADIAREVGVSPATLLQRFGDKQTLTERAFSRDNERFVVWLKSLPEGTGADAVVRIYGEATKLFGDNPSLSDHLLWLREDIRDPGFNRLALHRFKLFRAEILKRLPKMPIPAATAARLLDAQYHGAVIQWALEPRGKLVDFVMRNLRDWFRLGGF